MKRNKFNATKVKSDIVNSIKDWFENEGKCPNGPAVIGISGGKDSSVAAALCVEALGKDRVIGVLMPNGIQNDINDSLNLVNELGIKYLEINIESAFSNLFAQCKQVIFEKDNTVDLIEAAKTNLPPRLRMSVLYTIAQINGGRVINTCNLSETLVGWETRWGDSVGDYGPLSDLTKTEIVEIGLLCDIPSYLVLKTPSDGLCGEDDETKLGFTYDELDNLIRTGEKGDNFDKILKRIKFSEFKRKPFPIFKSNLPRYF